MTVMNPRRTDLIRSLDAEIKNQFKGNQDQSLSREDLKQAERVVNKVLTEYRTAIRNEPTER